MTPHLSTNQLLYTIVSILIAMIIHEVMHGYAALALGDKTAQQEGRLTLNPLNHIDPFMTIALPILTTLLFQFPLLAAKPVPFDNAQLKYYNYGPALVAIAGPLSNLALAIISSLLFHSASPGSAFANFLDVFTVINVALFVFNLIPIPPLDGSRVLYAFAPESVQRAMMQFEPYGLVLIFSLAIAGGLGFLGNIIDTVLNLLP
jgi:Zn-dependent protease